MEFGLFSNGERGNAIAQATYDEDMAEVVYADALGMDEDDAMIDACKVEHLISNEARARLVCFLRMLFSEEPSANEFLQNFHDGALECRSGDVDSCRLCEETCFGYRSVAMTESD